ncbi:MAG TPA: glycerate kinase [Verrucomicrobiae bacterium]|nr:glycerate kinase [Verrucomicrobiae bacterium]
MSLKVLIAPDKFKGTLTARAAAEVMAAGWLSAFPDASVRMLPMSDGGDGFGELLGSLLKATVQTIKTVDAASRPCVAQWWWEPKTKTAVIESAEVVGMAGLPAGRFHPFELDTFGLGAVVKAATEMGAKKAIIGIGGSATNDGGFGLARSVGWKFIDSNNQPLEQWIRLEALAGIKPPHRICWPKDLSIAVDVQNPLLGRKGATRVYGPQKGLRAEDIDHSERCLTRLAQVVKKDCGLGLARVAGSGAAGGLGFGLAAFLGAKLEPGFELFAKRAGLEERLSWADIVVTGEGSIDDSTLMGKGVGQIAARCRELQVPCIGLAGSVTFSRRSHAFAKTYALTDLTTDVRAKARAAFWLERAAKRAGQEWLRDAEWLTRPATPRDSAGAF